MITHSTNQESGFTLVEFLLYLFIFGLVISIAFGMFRITTQARLKNQTIAEVEQQGQFVMNYITQAVRNADTINAPAAGSAGSSLSVQSYVTASNPIVFDLNTGAIRASSAGVAASPITNNKVTASNFMITNASRTGTPGTIKIQFTLARAGSSVKTEYIHSKTFYGSATLR